MKRRFWFYRLNTCWVTLIFMICTVWEVQGIEPPLASDILGNQAKMELPFEYRQGFIVVDVLFQKVFPMKFILDTGAENTILLKKQYAEILRLPYHKTINILGSDMRQYIPAYISNGVYLQLDKMNSVRHNIIILETDITSLEELLGSQVDGILGVEFFKGLVMRINYKRNLLTIYNPSKFEPSKLKGFNEYDIKVIANKPYLDCMTEIQLNKPIKTKLLLDTGAGLTALFHNNTDSLLKMSNKIVKGNLGKGLGGEIEGYSGKIHSLKIGDFTFGNMISSFQALDSSVLSQDKIVRNGLIGNLLLERFEIIIDLYHSKLYLKGHKNYSKAFEFDKSGLSIYSFGTDLKQFYVKYVVEGSPASEVDIRPGDIITKIGFWPASYFRLESINKKLMGKSGKKIKLTLNRDGEKLIKVFVLKDLFEINK